MTNYIEDNSEEIFKVNHEILQCNEILKKNGIKTAILSNAFLLKDGESALQIKDGLFEVVSVKNDLKHRFVMQNSDNQHLQMCR